MSRFLSIFLSSSAKNLEGEPFCDVFWKVSGTEEVCGWEGRGGEYQKNLPKTFCLTVPNKFVGEPSMVSLVSEIEKFYA